MKQDTHTHIYIHTNSPPHIQTHKHMKYTHTHTYTCSNVRQILSHSLHQAYNGVFRTTPCKQHSSRVKEIKFRVKKKERDEITRHMHTYIYATNNRYFSCKWYVVYIEYITICIYQNIYIYFNISNIPSLFLSSLPIMTGILSIKTEHYNLRRSAKELLFFFRIFFSRLER